MNAPAGPRGPNPITGRDVIPFLILAIAGVALLAVGDLWATAGTSTVLTGHGWTPPPYGTATVSALRQGVPGLAPAAPAWLVWVVLLTLTTVQVTLAGVTAVVLSRRHRQRRGPAGAMATARDLPGLTAHAAAERARLLRRSLSAVPAGRITPADAGVTLGRLEPGGELLLGSWEDVYLLLFAPRSGKTTAFAVPGIIATPGPAVVTSNKSDVWAATAELRAEHGRVWTFDPQSIARAAQDWWWDALDGIDTVEVADRFAAHFLAEMQGGQDPFWTEAAGELLTGLLLAAASRHDADLRTVWEWLADPSDTDPVDALMDAGHTSVAEGLRGTINGADDTRQGIYQTARTAARCLRDPDITAWVTPPRRTLPRLDLREFIAGRDTLYLLSKDAGASAAPLVAALTDRVMRTGVLAAETHGGRLDPPLLAVLDEAANICKIRDLPDLYSHLGSRGVIPMTILQSYQQGVRVWGEPGMAALWGAATIKLIGAGMDDARFAGDVSTLVGEHDVTTRSISRSRDGWNESDSLRRQRILEAADVRALPKGTALLLATGARAALVQTLPWYTSPDADRISKAVRRGEDGIRDRAAAAWSQR